MLVPLVPSARISVLILTEVGCCETFRVVHPSYCLPNLPGSRVVIVTQLVASTPSYQCV